MLGNRFFCFVGALGLVSGLDMWHEELTKGTVERLEKHWRGKMTERRFDEKRPEEKLYVLPMFPYPSGFLHVGHVRVYGSSDVVARFFRMRGKNVIHPIGWDAFGLPAENAAFERGKDPNSWTQTNIAHMKCTLEELNISFDWDREVATCDSDYFRWTQFLFLQLLKKGLVYRKEAYVNWDPVDETVLAEEQVDESGRSWRSGALVEKKLLKQWFIRTSAFAKDLSEGLKELSLEGWQDIVDIQRHWIGEVNGTSIDFEVVEEGPSMGKRSMGIWMKRPELIDKGKFVAVKEGSVWACEEKGEKGLLQLKVKNPFTGDVLPVYLTDAVSYAEGAEVHLGMPGMDEEDRRFADSVGVKYSMERPNLAREEELECFREKICSEARERGIGGYPTSSKLKDWAISRQRYWGTPIPIVHCEKCGEQGVAEEELPVRLPKLTGKAKGRKVEERELDEWLVTSCPKCGGEARRETDTMDTFVDSSWYYLRFLDPDNQQAAFDVEKVHRLMPVDVYIGGKEHATLHLYYARFMNHFLYSVGLVPHREPFRRFLPQGIVKGLTYMTTAGMYVPKESVEEVEGKFYHKDSKEPLMRHWAKMSKSKHNSVQPKELIAEHGVDTTRLVVLRCSSTRGEVEWNDQLFQDIFRWQRRLWLTVSDFIHHRTSPPPKPQNSPEYDNLDFFIFDSRNYYVKMITQLIEERFEVGVALMKLQGLTNSLRKVNKDIMTHSLEFERALAVHIILLAPFAPYFASELWAGFLKAPNRLCYTKEILWDRPVLDQPWPQVDPHYESKSQKISTMITFSKTKKELRLQKKKAKSQAKSTTNGTDVEDDMKSRRA